MARAMHCITNHDVWSRTSDFASQSLFPLSLISASVGIVNEEKSMSMVVSSPLMLPAPSGWRVYLHATCQYMSLWSHAQRDGNLP